MRIGIWTALLSLMALLVPVPADAQTQEVRKKRPASSRADKPAPKAKPSPKARPKPKAKPARTVKTARKAKPAKATAPRQRRPRPKAKSTTASRVANIAARPLSAIAPGSGIPLALADITAGEGIDANTAAALTLRLEREINRYQSFDLVPSDELAVIAGDAVVPGCFENETCRQTLSSAGVTDVLLGAIEAKDEKVSLRLAVFDVNQGKAVVEHAATGDTVAALFGEVPQGVQAVAVPLLGERRGHLLVSSSEPGATVKLDGRIVGTTPLNRIPVTWGPHRLEVSKDGFITSVEEVVVNTPGAIERHATLIPTPAHLAKYEGDARALRTAAWVTTGAAVAAVALAGFFQADYAAASSRVDELARNPEKDSERQAEAERASGSLLGARITGGAAAGLAVGAASLWIFGPNPDHYARYREVTSGAASH